MSGAIAADRTIRRLYLGIAGVIACVWLVALPSRPLFNPDEGRYAEIPREMLETRDFLIPHLNGLAYIEKPPLQYWATAAALWMFGNGEFAARLYPALCALATLVVVWWAADRLWGCAAAWRSASVLAGLVLFLVLGQLLTLDMSLTFYMTTSLAAFLLAQRAPGEDRGGAVRRYMLVAWAATALGVLTKGVVAAVLPAAVLVCYSIAARDASPWRRLHAGWGLPLFLAIAVPWHWAAAARLPDFLQFFFIHEHLARYLTPSADREEAWWFFAAVFALGSLPWTLSAVRVLATGWRRRAPAGRFDAALFLWVWVVFIGMFFSVSDSKLIPYILPVMPAVALAVGGGPAGRFRREVRLTGFVTVTLAALLGGAAAFGPPLLATFGTREAAAGDRQQYFVLLARPFALTAVLLAVSGLVALRTGHRDATRAAVALGAGWCLAGILLMHGAGAVAPIYSGIVLARAGMAIPPDVPVYSVGTYDQTLPFYWRRTVKLAAYRGELDYGLKANPEAELPSVADFVAEWRRMPDAYAVMEKSMFDQLRTRAVPMREIARDVRHVLVARR